MRIRKSELAAFITDTLLQIKLGVQGIRTGENPLMAELPESVQFQIELINDADGVADITVQTVASSDSNTETRSSVTETEVEAAATQTETEVIPSVTQTTTEGTATETTVQDQEEVVTVQDASTDSSTTEGTQSRVPNLSTTTTDTQTGGPDIIINSTSGGDTTNVNNTIEEF